MAIKTYNYTYWNNTGKNPRNHVKYQHYLQFIRDYEEGKYPHQRFGQAFYNKFDSMPSSFPDLFYEENRKSAQKLIEKSYKFYE